MPGRRVWRGIGTGLASLASIILFGTCGLDQLTSSSKIIDVQLSKDTVMVVGTAKAFWADTGNVQDGAFERIVSVVDVP